MATVTSFQEVERSHRWAVLLRHADLVQRVHVPAHRVLWWSWGNAERPLLFTETEFRFSRLDTALARALRHSLAAFEVPKEPTRKVSMPPRSARIGTLTPYRVERPALYRYRRRARDIYEELYGGHHLFWRWRLLGWALFGLPFLLIEPWLGPAGVALFELLIIGLTQLSLYRARRRM